MTKYIVFLFLVLQHLSIFAQDVNQLERGNSNDVIKAPKNGVVKGTLDQYRIITLEKDTTYIDTSLNIKKEYKFNYLRRDTFGLLPLPNEGQPYNVLKPEFINLNSFPGFGYNAKQFNYLNAEDINYYSVATPLTELYFKTVMEQGQTLDAFITINTSTRLNFSIAYKGLRSLGKYINQLSSAGNFRFTTSYNTKNNRYFVNAHFTSQDLANGENGGLVDIADFSNGENIYKNRVRINVFSRDGKSELKGKRFFVDHSFMINRTKGNNNLYAFHQFNYEDKLHRFTQGTLTTQLDDNQGQIQHYGPSYRGSMINDEVKYNRMYNKVGAAYESLLLGKFSAFVEDFRSNYFYDRILVVNNEVVPGSISRDIATLGGQYDYRKDKWRGKIFASNSITNQSLAQVEATLQYTINPKISVIAEFQKLNKLPDNLSLLHQSSYVEYNWTNNYKNEKYNNLSFTAKTSWVDAQFTYSVISDKIFYGSDSPDVNLQIVTPKQYDKSINYLSAQLGKEFKYGKFALDNTVLFQETQQDSRVLNVPNIVTRNTLYYSDYFFKRALYLQTGLTLNYFTKYYANEYNPVIGEFFSQDKLQIGNFPTVDFFINARVQQTRIYLKAEHFNSSFTGNNYFSTPANPYRDFIIRFGLVWNFFQ